MPRGQKSRAIAGNVRRLREQKPWTQAELALAAGIDERTVQRVESGKGSSVETLRAIAAAFQIEVDALRDERPNVPPAPPASKLKGHVLIPLEPLARGADFGRVAGCEAVYLRCVPLGDDRLEDAVAAFQQTVRDWLDVWGDLEIIQRREAEKSVGHDLDHLASLGLVVAGGREFVKLRAPGANEPTTYDFGYVMVSRASDPKLILLRERGKPIRSDI